MRRGFEIRVQPLHVWRTMGGRSFPLLNQLDLLDQLVPIPELLRIIRIRRPLNIGIRVEVAPIVLEADSSVERCLGIGAYAPIALECSDQWKEVAAVEALLRVPLVLVVWVLHAPVPTFEPPQMAGIRVLGVVGQAFGDFFHLQSPNRVTAVGESRSPPTR